MATKPIPLLRLDLAGALAPVTHISPAELQAQAPKLLAAREFLLNDAKYQHLFQPERLLAEYKQLRKRSELGRILLAAHRWLYVVDRVVVLGSRVSHLAPLALMAACCEPYYDQLTRGERGGRPLLIFKTHHLDNDSTQGLLALLGNGREATSLEERWGLIVIDPPGDHTEIEAAYSLFLSTLQSSLGEKALSLILPVTSKGSEIHQHASSLKLPEMFDFPNEGHVSNSPFSTASLLPAAMLGIDVPRLLNGAAKFTDHFRTACFEENLALQLAAIHFLISDKTNFIFHRLRAWSQGLEGVVRWYDSGWLDNSVRPPSEWSCLVNLIVDQWRHDAMTLPHINHQTLPELLRQKTAQTQAHDSDRKQPSIQLHLPHCDEAALGQLLQLIMLADLLEAVVTLAD